MSIKVFYTASYSGKERYQQKYDLVREAIEKCEVDMISPEIGNYELVLSQSERSAIKDSQELHYKAVKRGIQITDATIIEISNEDFQLGHEATLAIQNKKHVLCLSVNQDYSTKISDPFFSAARYNRFNIDEIVMDFIKHVSKERFSERFNFFLSPTQLNHIRKESTSNSVTTAEYLRSLIDIDMK